MRLFTIIALGVLLGACSLVYKLPTRQGNVIEQKQLDQLELGMTPQQVRFLLGTPLAASPFVKDRWDYVGYYKSPRGKESSRIVNLYFENGALTRMVGVETRRDAADAEPDVKTLLEQEKADETTREAPETGVTITPD